MVLLVAFGTQFVDVQDLAREIDLNEAWHETLAAGLAQSAAGSEDHHEFASQLRGIRVEGERLAGRKAKLEAVA